MAATLVLACYLFIQVIFMSVVMDYKAAANVQALKGRLFLLNSTDAWFPITYFDGIEKSMPGIVWLWDFLGFKKEDFFGLVKENEMWSEADNAKWSPIFAKWGLTNAEVRHHGTVERATSKIKMKFANFSSTKAASLDPFFTGTSGISSPTSFLIPNAEDSRAHHGFVFVEVPLESPVAKKRATSASSSSSDLPPMDSIMESIPAMVTPESRANRYVCSICSNFSQDPSPPASASTASSSDIFVNVSAFERGQATLADKKGAFRIMAALQETAEENPHINLVPFSSNETPFRRNALFLRLPETWYTDESEVHRSTVYRKTTFLEWIFSYIGAGVLTLARFIVRNVAGVSRAAVAKSGMSSRVLTVEETIRFQTRLGLSHSRLRDARKDFNVSEYPMKFAPESKIKKWADELHINASHIEGAALAGSKGSVYSLVYHVHSAAEAAQRDLDVNFKNKTYKPCAFQCDDSSDIPVMSFIYMNDWGGKSDKHVLRLLDVQKSNSPVHCTIIGSAETMRADDSMKPSGCWENFDFVLSRVDGLIDFERNFVLRMGNSSVLFPKHTKPAAWTWEQIAEADRGAFFAAAYGSGSNPVEKAACRAGIPAGSATLVVINSKCIGIRAGPVTFPFRCAVDVDTTSGPAPILFATSLYTSADLLALSVIIGNPGQAGCSCPFCRCSAPKFKAMATDAAEACELRTAATQATDYYSFVSSAVKINNINGVSFPSLFPNGNFGKIIPPVLHLILGLVNDQMQYLWKELQVWDGSDPRLAKELAECVALVEETELDVASYISAAAESLPGNAAFAAVIGNSAPGDLVPQSSDLTIFQPLIDALEEAAADKLQLAVEAETLPHQPSGHSGRVRGLAAQKASAIRAEAEELSVVAKSLTESLTALAGARSLLDEHTADEDGAPKSGVLTAVLKEALQLYGISMQRYWNGTLVGPDVRKLLRVYDQILQAVAAEMAKIHGDAEAARFVHRYSSVFAPLCIISHLTRSTLEGREKYGRFSPEQLTELDTACATFGQAFRAAHERMLTVKGHIVERHIPLFARHYGILGIFGEDGLESLHPLDSRIRLITRTMRNPKRRSIATMRHMDMAKHGKGAEHEKRKRARSSAAAAAAEGSDEEAPGATIDDVVAALEDQDEEEAEEETPAELIRIAAVRNAAQAADAAAGGSPAAACRGTSLQQPQQPQHKQ